jgi:hypothetical protein
MRHATERALDRDWAVYAACATSLALGLFFIFVWAPHPWGQAGFDQYHDFALDLARGRPFPTMEVPWAYAYFLAGFYRTFGDHPWIPLVVQAMLNALVPLLTFEFARTWCDRRTAVVAAVLTGVFSFNTIYASTQSSDAVCTVIFMAAIVAFTRALGRRGLAAFAVTGAMTGIASQFRPNLILLPLLLAAYGLWAERSRRRLAQTAVLLGCAVATVTPWVVRNYRLTGTVLPTSVHGGVQLWYGTLQVGPYLGSRAYNPRSLFEMPVFEYTSLDHVPIVVEAQVHCSEAALTDIAVAYWSDYDTSERRVAPARAEAGHYTFEIPAPERDAVVYYYFASGWSEGSGRVVRTTPAGGARAPFVYFVNHNHLGDLDVHGDLLDVFDVVRFMRRTAWKEPLPFADKLHSAGVTDVRQAVAVLMYPLTAADTDGFVSSIQSDAATARMSFADGSTMEVPRLWRGRITDLTVTEGMASRVMTSRIPVGTIASVHERPICAQVDDIAVNQVFYRREPHMMRRYAALALDNIQRDPVGFALASGYRAVRLFVIAGTSDRLTTQQFSRSRWIYPAAMGLSIVYLTLFGIGVAMAWRRGHRVGLPLLLIAYLPATLAPVLTNMRYTLTVQPLMFMFIAVAIVTLTRSFRGEGLPAT